MCLYPKCTRESEVRGLCRYHYTYAAKLVRSKKVTWEQLEKKGKVLPRKSTTKIQTWFVI